MRRIIPARTLLAVMVVAGGLVVQASPASAAPIGFTVDISDNATFGHLLSLDLATGVPTDIGDTGVGQVEALSLACSGTLYGISDGNDLITISTSTGLATTVGPLGVDGADWGMTFGSDGKLWAADEGGEFFEVNKATGAATLVGTLSGKAGVTGMAAAADGTIFGFDRNHDELVTIDPATAVVTVIGPSVLNLNVAGLDFDANGTLWAVDTFGAEVTATFNTTTGTATEVASTSGYGFASLAIVGTNCEPPPTTTTVAPTTTLAVAATPAAVTVQPAFTG